MVTVQLDRKRQLKLTLRGMLAYEQQTGKNLLKGFDIKSMTMADFTALMWACLIYEDKELTYEAFLDMVDVGDIATLTDAVSQCIVESFPDKGESKGAPLARKRRSG